MKVGTQLMKSMQTITYHIVVVKIIYENCIKLTFQFYHRQVARTHVVPAIPFKTSIPTFLRWPLASDYARARSPAAVAGLAGVGARLRPRGQGQARVLRGLRHVGRGHVEARGHHVGRRQSRVPGRESLTFSRCEATSAIQVNAQFNSNVGRNNDLFVMHK